MDRRTFLRKGGSAALALAMGGCAPALSTQRAPRRPLVALYPVEVGWDRVIRTTVGHRPVRDSGFMLRPERFDEKTVIHNFGHGGAGMSLSWGTAQMAAELALAHTGRRAAVIGCGIIGLTTARQLQRRGFDVTLYARTLPPETASNMSWAGFTPASGLVTRRTPEFDALFRRAIEIAYREHQLLVGRDYGVSWIYSYSPTDSPPGQGGARAGGGSAAASPSDPLVPAAVETGTVFLQPGEHPFPTRYARRSPTLRFEPAVYLEALMRDVLTFGGRIVVREFDTPRDLMLLDEELIVNCTGLGAKRLFGDEELTPVKGQLTVLVPQPEVNYSLGGMMPRRDGIVLGHVNVRGDWSFDVDEEAKVRVMENAMRAFANFSVPRTAPPLATAPVAIEAPPVESFLALQS